MIRSVIVCLALLICTGPVHAWSEGGHTIIALFAYDLLDEPQQQELVRILKTHPNFAKDFQPPKGTTDVDRWYCGRAGYWPDVARSYKEFNRPTWHYQLGATIKLGNVNVPGEPGPLPDYANLDTTHLYVTQALELCFNVLKDHNSSEQQRALAICWLAHLVGDIHQPCHAGSIYVEGVFDKGDRGANQIDVKQDKNLHSLWDGLLGKGYNASGIKRRLGKLRTDKELVAAGRKAVDQSMDSHQWIQESREAARQAVYTQEVMGPITAAARGLGDGVGKIYLSEEYLKNAGRVAQIRAAQAGYRLAEVWRLGMQ